MNYKAEFQVICMDRHGDCIVGRFETEDNALECIKSQFEIEKISITENFRLYIRKVYKGDYGL